MFSVNNKPRNKHCSAMNTWQHVTIQTQKDHNWQITDRVINYRIMIGLR